MRYSEITNIEFTSANNNIYTIKDKRIIPKYNIVTKLKNNGSLGDEVAVKREIYGENSENLTYRIYEANIISLIENRFDFTKLKEINIPTIED